MQDALPKLSRVVPGNAIRLSGFARVRSQSPSLIACGVALVSAVLLIISFPNFDLWPLAWVGLVPLLVIVARDPRPWPAFLLGWLFGTVFFYGSCYWLTYSMIHTGGISPVLAYPLLLPGAIVVGIFPAFFTFLLARAIRRWGAPALFLAPLFWPALEWARLEVTGQLWNAIGYSQAYHPSLIRTASWGGVYAVSFQIVFVNAALAFVVFNRTKRSVAISAVAILSLVIAVLLTTNKRTTFEVKFVSNNDEPVIVALQPNVPMDLIKSVEDTRQLTARHFEMSEAALRQLPDHLKDETGKRPRLVIWPESPMNFAYGGDTQLRDQLVAFAQANHTSVLLNSQEVAPNNGIYNSAVLINEEGKLVAQYDKIRLLPFGEYVPLPKWLPGAGLITGMVGEFTPGSSYPLMNVGQVRAGVFICIESAYPSIARNFTGAGADVLINISNDGYLGPTAVMRQHLANAIFRAVENGRPVLRVTNTGITAFITSRGEVREATQAFQPEVRIWTITGAQNGQTFYARHGDLFVVACALVSLLIFVLSFKKRVLVQNPSVSDVSVISEDQ